MNGSLDHHICIMSTKKTSLERNVLRARPRSEIMGFLQNFDIVSSRLQKKVSYHFFFFSLLVNQIFIYIEHLLSHISKI